MVVGGCDDSDHQGRSTNCFFFLKVCQTLEKCVAAAPRFLSSRDIGWLPSPQCALGENTTGGPKFREGRNCSSFKCYQILPEGLCIIYWVVQSFHVCICISFDWKFKCTLQAINKITITAEVTATLELHWKLHGFGGDACHLAKREPKGEVAKGKFARNGSMNTWWVDQKNWKSTKMYCVTCSTNVSQVWWLPLKTRTQLPGSLLLTALHVYSGFLELFINLLETLPLTHFFSQSQTCIPCTSEINDDIFLVNVVCVHCSFMISWHLSSLNKCKFHGRCKQNAKSLGTDMNCKWASLQPQRFGSRQCRAPSASFVKQISYQLLCKRLDI